MSTRILLVVLTMILGIVCPTWAGDADNDGVSDAVDVCSNTPAGTLVDAEGRPVGDLDKDCDNDLDDFTLSQQGFTGPLPPPRMALIPAGVFLMGDTFDEGELHELPVHAVYVDAFYMDTCEVTNQQYADFLNWAYNEGSVITVTNGVVYKAGSGTSCSFCDTATSSTYSQITWNGSMFGVASGKELYPMTWVSWYGAVAYANWRSTTEGKPSCYDLSTWVCSFGNGYRLPTEAEWEKAARGGLSGRRFPWGNTINHDHANYRACGICFPYDDSSYLSYTYHPTFNTGANPYTSPVGYFATNHYGLHDMVGNVWELCNDRYSDSYYGNSPYSNPLGPINGDDRVLRGGSWHTLSSHCRSSARDYYGSDSRGNSIGFRLVLGFN